MSVSEINNLWYEIMNKFHHIPRSEDFFNYYTDTRIEDGCLFPRHLWNYYDFNGPRTNNGLEGWHHRLNSNIATSNPNLYVTIDELKKDYAFNIATIQQVANNTNKPPRNKKFIYPHLQILDLMKRYEKCYLSLDEYFNKTSKTIGKKSK